MLYLYGVHDGYCGLTDGSGPGDWRVPNNNELASLVNKGYYWPALPNTGGSGKWSQGDPFNNVQPYPYWSSSTFANHSDYAWIVNVSSGSEVTDFKNSDAVSVWPVRGGR